MARAEAGWDPDAPVAAAPHAAGAPLAAGAPATTGAPGREEQAGQPLTRHERGEQHLSERANWLRAAVLGANDGIVSVSSLLVGVAASGVGTATIATAGVAGLAGGALSMAAGEYVSVSSQRDTEEADLALERHELEVNPAAELRELAEIYERRGLRPDLARQVAEELTARDALGAHARDELGLADEHRANPLQAAWASAAAFSVGAALPLGSILLSPVTVRIAVCVAATLVALVLLGALGARLGGAPKVPAAVRVAFWGALAMAATFGLGSLFGTSVA